MRMIRPFWTLAIVVTCVAFQPQAAGITGLELRVNTIDTPEVWFELAVSGLIDSDSTTALLASEPLTLTLYRSSDDAILTTSDHDCIQVPDDSLFSLILKGSSRELVSQLHTQELSAYLQLSHDLSIVLQDCTVIILTNEHLQLLCLAATGLSKNEFDMIRRAQQGHHTMYEKSFDVSKEIANSDTTQSEYALTYTYRKSSGLPFAWLESSGRLSTDRYNPLNNLNFSCAVATTPVRLGIGRDTVSGRLSGEVKLLGNQPLDTSALGVSMGIDAAIPNLIDLTSGATRLRLRPIISFGIEYIRHFQRHDLYGCKEDTWAGYLDIYYYLPVGEKLAVILEGTGRAGKDLEVSDNIRWDQTTTLAYDLPLEDLKVLVKYVSGGDKLTLGEDRKLLMGLLANHLPF